MFTTRYSLKYGTTKKVYTLTATVPPTPANSKAQEQNKYFTTDFKIPFLPISIPSAFDMEIKKKSVGDCCLSGQGLYSTSTERYFITIINKKLHITYRYSIVCCAEHTDLDLYFCSNITAATYSCVLDPAFSVTLE